MSYELIETVELTSSAASIEFTSIPQDGTDLVVLFSGRTSDGGTADVLSLKFNGLTSGFSWVFLYGNGSSVLTNTGGGSTNFYGPNGDGSTTNTFSNTKIYISNYTSSANKSFSVDTVAENNATTGYQEIDAALWSNTAPITSISVGGFANLLQYSTASLYKITAA